jgi:hypothetical protein
VSICEDGVPEGVLRDEVAKDDILPRTALGSRGEVGAQGVGVGLRTRTCMTVGSDINL